MVALIAVLVLAWVGVLVRDREVGEEARMRVFTAAALSAEERDRAAERLTDAQLFNSDSSWELLRASYYLLDGRGEKAAEIAEAMVRDEPANVEAWSVVREATRLHDPGRSAQAAAELRRLDPLGFPGAPRSGG